LGGDTNLLVSTDEGEPLTVRIFGQDGTRVGEKVALDFDDNESFIFNSEQQRAD
jgi:multiple sugar transport system ATP-binding protein